MPTIKESTANYNILASGSLFTFKEEPLIIDLNDADGITLDGATKLTVEINFVNDSEKGRDINTAPATNANGEYLKVTIYNAKGEGSSAEPLLIAQHDQTYKKVLLSLSFQQFNDSFLCNYTIFKEK